MTVLSVRFVINPQCSPAIVFRVEPGKKALLKILAPDCLGAQELVQGLKKCCFAQREYEVSFNWKNTPATLRGQSKMQGVILQLFQKLPLNSPRSHEEKYRQWADLVWQHAQAHGAAPDFAAQGEKKKQKVCNYMRTILAQPQLSLSEMEKILHFFPA